ncbi:hypothetical protein ACPPVO_29645 [Dactylosporangium sp. McL0621]|uniref:hypothetical protein n=1 Tax=Dactylosporangium sp. McL0621 TaxID=3415678 RepID=UPI003CF1A85A
MGPYEHPAWCARGHRCNLGEHRAHPMVMEVDGVGKVLITRVLGNNGRERVEVAGSAYLTAKGPAANRQVDRTLRGFAHVMASAAAR